MLHARAFKATVVWTLLLLWLGSVVHATESSLACPDWPTCFGTMVPEMTGGVFWEHLHRLVAGGLLLMWGLATWLAHKEARDRPWIFRACLAGIALLLVQSVLGGITVIYRLPDLVSTAHLALAFSFLGLAAHLASAGPRDVDLSPPSPSEDRTRTLALGAAGLVFAQSVLGALVRHTDAGMACPDVPLCLGRVVPPLVNGPIAAHFLHRLLALVVAVVVLGLVVAVLRRRAPERLRRWVVTAGALVVAQVALGVASVLTALAPIPVSLHTLFAASLLAVLVHAAQVARASKRSESAPMTPAALGASA